MEVNIFISYSQEDFFARGVKIKNYLSKLIPNSNVFIDQDKSKGQDWREKNEEKLEQAHIVIVILTPAALQSEEIAREVEISNKQKKRILPCKDDALDLSWSSLPWGLSKKDGITFEEDEVLKTRLFREVRKILKEMNIESPILVPVSTTIHLKSKLKHGDIPVIYNKRHFNLPYFVNKGSVSSLSAKIDEEVLGVLLDISCNEDTKIGISLPRTLIDSKQGLDDDNFFVIVDGEDASVSEKSEEKQRTVTLELKKGDHSVEIIGNQLLGISIGVVTMPENKIRILPGSSVPNDLEKYLEPETLRIKQGETVTWENNDSAAHTVTSGTPSDSDSVGAFFDSSLFMAGSTYKISFNNKGTFEYFCIVHPWKKGRIIVE